MGSETEAGIQTLDAWLLEGGFVVTASERTARAIAAAYHRARRAQGLTAWAAPQIQNWEEFARRAWQQRSSDPRLLLNSLQEQAVWAEIIAADRRRLALLEGPLYRVANLAMEAHRLLCLYAPQFLPNSARASWQQDAGAFSAWLSAFHDTCRAAELISPARLPLELAALLEADAGRRPPLLLAGFDRILPVQRRVFDAWGECREPKRPRHAERIFFHRAADESAELAACALWSKEQHSAAPQARLLIVTQDAAQRRGEIERAFLNLAGSPHAANGGAPLFEFSLGVPLKNVPLARGALLVLRWLSEPIAEAELDWLLSTGQIAADEEETQSLAAFMRALRRRGWERTRWRLEDFLRQKPGSLLPESWIARISQATRRLDEFERRPSSASQPGSAATPMAWAELAPQLLQLAGWPGGRGLTSAEFQALRRWQQMLDECGSLAFDGRRIEWNHFLRALERALQQTLFAPESQDAPILIAGPAESAGLAADAVWFLGASEEAWPSRGAVHPLIPLEVQRGAAMPHSSAQLDWDLAQAITERLLAAAPAVHFSYPRQKEGVEARASRLVVNAVGAPRSLPAELTVPRVADALAISFEDRSRIPFPGGEIRGGSNLLTAQSQCAFKAFAIARLGAQSWQPAEAGLTPAQRGQLLHAVLHSIWSGPPDGLRGHAELIELADPGAFVEKHVHSLLPRKIPASAREQMPRRYLELEAIRLTALITEWLRFEATRASFLVEGIEVERERTIAGLALKLRLDRLDRLADRTSLVIDYKTGDVSQKSWEMPRPDDVQLPLYAGFALDRDAEPLGGLVFAKVRAAGHSFAGRASDAAGQLLPGISARSDLVKKPLALEDLEAWRLYIETIAREFVEGRADVNPREYPKTCERCGLQTLCRIAESRARLELDAEEGGEAENA